MQDQLLQRHVPHSDAGYKYCYWFDRYGCHCRDYWHGEKCTRKEGRQSAEASAKAEGKKKC